MGFLNDYHIVNPIDQWVKILVTVTGFAQAYPLHCLIHHFKIFRQNLEPVAPSFGAKIRNNVSENEVGTSVLKIYPYLSRSNFGQKSILLLAVLDCNPQLWSYVLIQREHPFLIV